MKIKLILFLAIFLAIASNVNANVISHTLQYKNQNYNYAVINREYDLFVNGNNLTLINHPEISIIRTIFDDNITQSLQYRFKPNTTAGLRDFGEFSIDVKSEADELVNSIGNVTLEVNDNNSIMKINNIDLSNKIIRIIDINLADFNISGSTFDMANILGGLNFDLNFTKNNNHPSYNYLKINGSATTIFTGILIFTNLENNFSVIEINYNPILLNTVIDRLNGDKVNYEFNVRAIKQSNDFSFYSDKGYSFANKSDLNNLQNLINEKVKFINPNEIVNILLPLGNFSNFTQFVDFDITVDFGNLRLEDGNYDLKILYTDAFGNKGEKPFTVRLDVTNAGSFESINNKTLIFTDPIINQTLERIENLTDNINLTAIVFGKIKPNNFLNPPSNINAINYLQINANQEINRSFNLFFKIDKSLISANDKNNVFLYVDENGVWNVLSTSLISETLTEYKYKSIIHHFSNYMIGVQQIPSLTSSSSGGGGGGGGNNNVRGNLIPYPIPIKPVEQPEQPQPSNNPENQNDETPEQQPNQSNFNFNLKVIFFTLFIFLMVIIVVFIHYKKGKQK